MAKNFLKLFESELEKAEITLAIRDVSDSLQKMASDLSKMNVDEIPSVVERIKVSHGVAKGNEFGQMISATLNELIQSILEAKSGIDDNALVISGDASQSDIAPPIDMEKEPDLDMEEPDLDMDPSDDEESEPELDLFDEPKRKVKESIRSVRRLMEKLTPEKRNVIKEMYKSGGKNRKKVIELAKKVK